LGARQRGLTTAHVGRCTWAHAALRRETLACFHWKDSVRRELYCRGAQLAFVRARAHERYGPVVHVCGEGPDV